MGLLMVPVGFDHGKYQLELAIKCRECFTDLVWTGPVTLHFEDKLNPEPDIIGWLDGNPYIVVEISNSTQKADFGYKKASYEANGIPFYVVFELRERKLYTWGLVKDKYVESPEFLKPFENAMVDVTRSPNNR